MDLSLEETKKQEERSVCFDKTSDGTTLVRVAINVAQKVAKLTSSSTPSSDSQLKLLLLSFDGVFAAES